MGTPRIVTDGDEEKKRKKITSCWGCGLDYMERWASKDLCQHPTNPDEVVCPDCHEEICATDGEEF